jgi:hypothetical protein
LANPRSVPHDPKSNSIVERRVKQAKEGIRTIMAMSGLFHQFWPSARGYFSFATNTLIIDGDSSYNKRHQEGHCDAERFPYGSLIEFTPNRKRLTSLPTFGSRLRPGLFLGWETYPGGRWTKAYTVLDLEDAKNFTFKSQLDQIQITREVFPYGFHDTGKADSATNTVVYPLFEFRAVNSLAEHYFTVWCPK